MSSTPFSCDVLPQGSLTVDQAQAHILTTLQPITATETCALTQALGRVLAQPLMAAFAVPPHRNSAMDGYAVNSSQLQTGLNRLQVMGVSLAGHPYLSPIAAGQCVRITTGAVVPEGADAIAIQEDVQLKNDWIEFEGILKAGTYVRHPGDDLKAGEEVLPRGRVLNAADLGLIASLGMAEVTVYQRVKVAFFSTGDELQPLGQALGVGQIYDSNRYTLHAMLQRLGVDIMDLGIVRDQPEAVEAAFKTAMQHADVLITSGGVSVGEADFVTKTLARLGQVSFWKIAMKPGKPLAFGQLGKCLFFGLPGNPVSVMATFLLFVRPALLALGQYPNPAVPSVQARCLQPFKKAVGRRDYQRGIASQGADGNWQVASTGLQESHVLRSMSVANCFVVLPLEWGDVAAGTLVNVILFKDLL